MDERKRVEHSGGALLRGEMADHGLSKTGKGARLSRAVRYVAVYRRSLKRPEIVADIRGSPFSVVKPISL